MTENKAIKVIETEKQCVLRNNENRCDRDCICCDLVMAENDIICGYDMAIKALEEIRQYRAICTVEECRKAMERQRAKKPIKDEHNHDCCPNCGWIVYQDECSGRYLPHCENCGQAIDWSKTD